jgi:hypothetical protein
MSGARIQRGGMLAGGCGIGVAHRSRGRFRSGSSSPSRSRPSPEGEGVAGVPNLPLEGRSKVASTSEPLSGGGSGLAFDNPLPKFTPPAAPRISTPDPVGGRLSPQGGGWTEGMLPTAGQSPPPSWPASEPAIHAIASRRDNFRRRDVLLRHGMGRRVEPGDDGEGEGDARVAGHDGVEVRTAARSEANRSRFPSPTAAASARDRTTPGSRAR